MRRVSSRQRLVSWDAFDATATRGGEGDNNSDLSDSSDYEYSCSDAAVTTANEVEMLVMAAKMMHTATRTGSFSLDHNININDDDSSDTSSVRDLSLLNSVITEEPRAALAAQLPARHKKRGRRKHHGPPAVVPSFAWEIASTENNAAAAAAAASACSLEDLVDDVQLQICSFLDLVSLRSVLGLNHKYRTLVLSPEATADIWMPQLQKRWPMTKLNLKSDDDTTTTTTTNCIMGRRRLLVDAYSLPTATSNNANHDTSAVNVPLLLSMTPGKLPTEVDQTLLDHPRNNSNHPNNSNTRNTRGGGALGSRRSSMTRRITQQLMRAPRSSTKLEVYHQPSSSSSANASSNSPPLVRYTGPIGSGDRCIRANFPLPRPIRKSNSTTTWRMMNMNKPKFLLNAHPSPAEGVQSAQSGSGASSLFDLICQGARAVSRRGMVDWRPFVAPHWQADGTLDVTPALVAYYEVDILEPPAKEDDNDDDDSVTSTPPVTTRTTTRHPSECVAVGIATESFHVHTRMPGWDSLSFGYHGDDGGIFHSSGGMVERFGPTFGAGDTIGCGIDYVAQGIFFTLNGKFLGYGWKNIGVEFLHNDLYPVVGIDTNAPISLNMGTSRPFQYDLSEFHQKHANLIAPQYQFSTKSSQRGASNSSGGAAATTTSHRSLGSRSSSSGSLASRLSRRSTSKR